MSKTIGPEAGAETLHHLGSGDRHRGATGGTPKKKVVWLCGYGWHQSGADDDAFQLFKQLIEEGRIKPTPVDIETFLVVGFCCCLRERESSISGSIPTAQSSLCKWA